MTTTCSCAEQLERIVNELRLHGHQLAQILENQVAPALPGETKETPTNAVSTAATVDDDGEPLPPAVTAPPMTGWGFVPTGMPQTPAEVVTREEAASSSVVDGATPSSGATNSA